MIPWRLSKGSVLSSCEPELQELMRQIDAMVQAKRLEWEREKQTLQARLEVRQQEYNIQRATLQQKHTEVDSGMRVLYWWSPAAKIAIYAFMYASRLDNWELR